MAELGSTPDFCGLAVMESWWVWMGGYAYIHSQAPISLIVRLSELPEATASFNYAIAQKSVVSKFSNFEVLRCLLSEPRDYAYQGQRTSI